MRMTPPLVGASGTFAESAGRLGKARAASAEAEASSRMIRDRLTLDSLQSLTVPNSPRLLHETPLRHRKSVS